MWQSFWWILGWCQRTPSAAGLVRNCLDFRPSEPKPRGCADSLDVVGNGMEAAVYVYNSTSERLLAWDLVGIYKWLV